MESIGMLMLLLCGGCLTWRTRGVQFRRPFLAFRGRRADAHTGVSPYEAFATSLGACIGTGNIAGVAGAILLGGPGALVWMWLSALLCAASKYTEILYALRYGGTPMNYMRRALPRFCSSFLAPSYAAACLLSCLTMGNIVQVNAVTEAFSAAARSMDARPAVAALFCVLTALVSFGGAKRIGRASAVLVPLMSGLYALGALSLICMNAARLPAVLLAVFSGAFAPRAVTGGAVGFLTVLRVGVSRGVFTHEAGLGTAALAHGASAPGNAHRQALFGVLEVYIDTLLLCTLSALAILVSGVPLVYGSDAANGSLMIAAFSTRFGRGLSAWFIAGALALFAFTSVMSFSLYGAACAQSLFGKGARLPFLILFCALLPLGAYLDTSLAWRAADYGNALMALVNGAALIIISALNDGRAAQKRPPG